MLKQKRMNRKERDTLMKNHVFRKKINPSVDCLLGKKHPPHTHRSRRTSTYFRGRNRGNKIVCEVCLR